MKKLILITGITLFLLSCGPQKTPVQLPAEVTMSTKVLFNKIRGGWAGQTIGCTYGGPTQFKFKRTMI